MIENNKYDEQIKKLNEAIALLIGIDAKLPKGSFNKEHISVMQSIIDVDTVRTILQECGDLNIDQYTEVLSLLNKATSILISANIILCEKGGSVPVNQSLININNVKDDIMAICSSIANNNECM